MTTDQLSYWNLQETKRNHLRMEQLTDSANKEQARSNRSREMETHRSNVAQENLSYQSIIEQSRHNLAQEMETNRSNLANEQIGRDNVALGYANVQLGYDNLAETKRLNTANIHLNYNTLDETIRNNNMQVKQRQEAAYNSAIVQWELGKINAENARYQTNVHGLIGTLNSGANYLNLFNTRR